MRTRQALPYLAALLLLAWILGTLSRSGTAGAGILSNSYWLVYVVYFLPFIALVAVAAMIVYLVVNWRLLSDVLGHGMAKRRARKQSSTIQLVVWMGAWGIALGVLFLRCGGIFCSPGSSEQSLSDTVAGFVAGDAEIVFPPLLAGASGPLYRLANIAGSPVFSAVFLGLLTACSVILLRSFKVSLYETRTLPYLSPAVREEGAVAVRDALRVLELGEPADPRARILGCYQRMIRAAVRLGAHVDVDQTARELESGIRRTFRLKGSGIMELTRLFEEARYSLHPINELDSGLAEKCLLEIGEELKATSTVES